MADPDGLTEFFGPGGRLATSFVGYETRPEQEALAAAVARALGTGENLIVEAGTGVGKSLGYLVPALESGQRVVVSTATKALQEQLLTKDVPIAAAALGRELKVAVVKGRANYLCMKALDGFALLGSALLPRAEDARAYERMLPWIETTETGDRAELDFEPSHTLWSELAVGSDRCAGRRCPHAHSCFAEAARNRAQDADLIIANHALTFADLAVRRRSEDVLAVLPDHDALILDEAHKVEESAASWLGGRVSQGGIRQLQRDVERAAREAFKPPPARILAKVDRATERLLQDVAPAQGRRRLREVPTERIGVLTEALHELASALQGQGDDLDALGRRALTIAGDAAACADASGLDRVVWAEQESIAWAPVDVSDSLRDILWDRQTTCILVSATLTTANDFGFVRRRLGLDHSRELTLGSPYDFAAQALIYLPERMPDPRSPAARDAIADEVMSLCGHSRGRALVLTTSWRSLGEIAERVRDRLPYRVLVQGEQPRERLLEQFREEVDSVLIATQTFWQGVDVSGEALSLLVIDKLPFSAPGDPLVEARCERISALGGDWFMEYALPSAVLQLRQGFGRLIRGHADRGVVAVLDPRLRTKGYGRAFLNSLPDCPVTSDLRDVERFFAQDALRSAC
jgi:ATP-dependent DNA helicase DinG